MEGIPLAFVTERSPMLELLVTGNLECTLKLTHQIVYANVSFVI